MQKIAHSVFIILLSVSISIGVNKVMLYNQLDELQIPKIIIVDTPDLIEKLSQGERTPQAILADTKNIFSLLKQKGYIVIEKSSTLSFSQSYALPPVNMALVNAALRKEGLEVTTPEAMISEVKATSDKLNSLLSVR